VRIAFNNAITLANRMGYEAALVGTKIRFSVPAYRLDVINDQDIIEDVAIAYGYDYIQQVPISATQQGQLRRDEARNDGLRELMIGMEFSEAMNSYLTNEDTNFTFMRMKRHSEYVKIRNAKSATITMLRTSLLPSLLSNLGKSQHDKFPQRIFELDMAFGLEKGVPVETQHLAAVISSTGANLNDVKAILEAISDTFGLDLGAVPAVHDSFIEGRCAKITSGGKGIGHFGELHPEVLNNFGIEEPVVAIEMDLRDLVARSDA
jgi:phenylalanyl-tRNA synthetase beta chain